MKHFKSLFCLLAVFFTTASGFAYSNLEQFKNSEFIRDLEQIANSNDEQQLRKALRFVDATIARLRHDGNKVPQFECCSYSQTAVQSPITYYVLAGASYAFLLGPALDDFAIIRMSEAPILERNALTKDIFFAELSKDDLEKSKSASNEELRERYLEVLNKKIVESPIGAQKQKYETAFAKISKANHEIAEIKKAREYIPLKFTRSSLRLAAGLVGAGTIVGSLVNAGRVSETSWIHLNESEKNEVLGELHRLRESIEGKLRGY